MLAKFHQIPAFRDFNQFPVSGHHLLWSRRVTWFGYPTDGPMGPCILTIGTPSQIWTLYGLVPNHCWKLRETNTYHHISTYIACWIRILVFWQPVSFFLHIEILQTYQTRNISRFVFVSKTCFFSGKKVHWVHWLYTCHKKVSRLPSGNLTWQWTITIFMG